MTRWPELRVNVSRLRRRDRSVVPPTAADSVIEVDRAVRAGSDIAITTARIPEGEPIAVAGALTAGVNGIEFAGTVRAKWEGECRRCLEPVRGEAHIETRVLFVDDPEVVDDEADTYAIDDERVDLGAVVFEELMLALPLSPLCEDGCTGADPDRFPASVDADDVEAEPALDPRWAVLDQLQFDDSDAESTSVDEAEERADNL